MRIRWAQIVEQKVNKMPLLEFVRAPLIPTLAGAALAGLSDAAAAHQAPTGWSYPWACGSNVDYREVDTAAISEPSDADPDYVIRSTRERIAPDDRRIRQSPDGAFHWCAHQAGIDGRHTICLFVPPRRF
jgi:hypothetical protein